MSEIVHISEVPDNENWLRFTQSSLEDIRIFEELARRYRECNARERVSILGENDQNKKPRAGRG